MDILEIIAGTIVVAVLCVFGALYWYFRIEYPESYTNHRSADPTMMTLHLSNDEALSTQIHAERRRQGDFTQAMLVGSLGMVAWFLYVLVRVIGG